MARRAGKLAFCAALLGAVALSSVGIGHATAASRLCRQLEAELVSAGGRASPAQIKKYDSAIARQGQEMAKARSRANRAGCGFSILSGNVGTCATLNASMDRMTDNLDNLRRDRARLAKGASRRDRGRIMAELDANDCRKAKAADRQAQGKKKTPEWLLEKAPVESARAVEIPEPADPNGENQPNPLMRVTTAEPRRLSGEFRTMCVRTCDGYFFPMSNAASLRDFERDQKNCESSCPGTEMQVFYTRGVGDESANMTSSVTGKPYRELPTAYVYKKPGAEASPSCGCNATPGFEIIGGNPSAGVSSSPESSSITSFASPSKPITTPKAATAEDINAASAIAEEPELPAPDRKVRVVAPAFLPDPKAAIDLRVLAPTPDR